GPAAQRLYFAHRVSGTSDFLGRYRIGVSCGLRIAIHVGNARSQRLAFRDLFLQSCEALRSKMLELQVKLVLFSSLGLAIRKSLTRCVQVRDTCSVEKFASFSFLFRQHGVG